MKKHKFNLSHDKLFTCDLGELIPAGLVEVLPGDVFRHDLNALVRTQPLLTPVMHPTDVHIYHFFVPTRLLWSEWENFITKGPSGTSTPAYPTIIMPGVTGATVGSLADYLGVPTGVASLEVSALPFRAYTSIWNEYFRDQDLDTALTVSTASGFDVTTNQALQNMSWEKDYFTTARATEQKGPAVTIPLGTVAPVVLNPATGAVASSLIKTSSTGAVAATTLGSLGDGRLASGGVPMTLDLNGSHVANLAAASGVSVNVLRQSLAAQRIAETRQRKGSRYEDMLRGYGVKNLDTRLDKPEYLGGGRETIQFSEVLQTAADGDSPVATLRGHGIAAMRSNRYQHRFPEHGYVLTLFSVRPKTVYFQGLQRLWNRRTSEDHFHQEYQHIGQQAILNKELYAAGASPNGVFGYQDRYDEYRAIGNSLSGEFRSTLNIWHLAREFGAAPAINSTFVKCVPSERVFPVPADDVLLCMGRHNLMAYRVVSPEGNSFIR